MVPESRLKHNVRGSCPTGISARTLSAPALNRGSKAVWGSPAATTAPAGEPPPADEETEPARDEVREAAAEKSPLHETRTKSDAREILIRIEIGALQREV